MANVYNMVENSSFEQGTGTVPNRWELSNCESTDISYTASNAKDGNKVFCIVGNTSKQKNIHQTVWVGNGSENDTYMISGWANANSVPADSAKGVLFALDVAVDYTDGTTKWNVYPFNPHVQGWQYTSGVVSCDDGDASTNKTVKSLRVYNLYYNNLNSAYFDHMQLVQKSGAVYGYDDNGNQTTATSEGTKTTDVYDANNNLISSTDEEGKVTTYTYDSNNRMTSTTTSDGIVTSYNYDTYGNVVSTSTTSNGKTISTAISYSSNGNYEASATDERGKTTSTVYDTTKGVLNNSTDANGNVTTYTYDIMDRLVSVSAPNGSQTITQGYTYSGNRQSEITHNGFNYTFSYDAYGNPLTTNVGNRTLITNEYEENNGNLKKSTYGNGQYIENIYDEFDNTTATKWNGTVNFTYKYDLSGNLVQSTDLSRNVGYTYSYDGNGALINVKGTDGTSFSYSQGLSGRRTSSTYKVGIDQRTIGYQYDNGNNNSAINLPNNASVVNSIDGFGRVSSTVINTTAGTQLSMGYTYLNGTGTNTTTNVIASQTNFADGTWSYTYDGNGNILTVSQNNVQKIKYTYDDLNQIVREDNIYSDQSYMYAYDAGGNITEKSTYAYTTGELATATDTIAYTYSGTGWKDLLTSYDGNSITYDNGGNPLTYNGWTYTWQRGRQLASASNSENTITYQYNDSGIRTEKTVNGTTTHYYLEGGKVICEQSITNTIWYYYSANDELIGFELNGTPYYYTRNVQGDITAIVNTAGDIVAQYTYDAWGNILSMTDGSGIDISSNTTHVGYINPYRYRGYRYDNETGMYYLQSRYYNPEIGRFINTDHCDVLGVTITIFSGNLFSYCENNPVIRSDRFGFAWKNAWWNSKRTIGGVINLLISAIIGGGVSAIRTALKASIKKLGWKAACNYLTNQMRRAIYKKIARRVVANKILAVVGAVFSLASFFIDPGGAIFDWVDKKDAKPRNGYWNL